MSRAHRAASAATALLVCLTNAAYSAGIDLSWNDCLAGSSVTSNVNFVCGGVFDQSYDLVFQFKSPVDVPHLVGATAIVDLLSANPGALSPFWHFEAGGCNRSPVTGVTFFDAIPSTCSDQCFGDPWDLGSSGFESFTYVPDHGRPGVGRFVFVVERQDPVGIKAFINYYAFHLRFNNKNREACLGCNESVGIVWQNLRLESNDGNPPVELSSPDKFTNCVTINGGSGICSITEPRNALASGDPCNPTPARRQTWAFLKTLYR